LVTEAKQDYWDNIDYLLKEWDESVALSFIHRVDSVLELISSYPEIRCFPKTVKNTLREVEIPGGLKAGMPQPLFSII
jgi:plasmid stabilization system protein ParE